MTHTQDCSPLALRCEWTVKEKVGGMWIVRKRVRNIFTNYGLQALASALSGAYTAPLWLAIEAYYAVPTSLTAAGSGTIVFASRIDQAGDSQLILGVGLASQETVTYTSVTGTGPYTYTLSGVTANSHPTTDPCCRVPLVTDTVAQLSQEIQYDSTNFPNQRMQSPGGYSPGTAQWTAQFYFPGPTAQGFIALAGLTDNETIGQGNLHNHFALGYNNNNSSNDLEIDGVLTLANA